MWVTLLLKYVLLGAASRDYDILHQTGLTILDAVLYFLQHGDYKPNWAYFNLHIRSSSGGPRTHLRTSRSIAPYIENGAELAHSVFSKHLQLVTEHAMRVSGWHKHNTVLWQWCASGIQNTPSATFCATNCRCTARGPWPSPRSRRLTARPSAPTLSLFSQTQVKQKQILISCSLLCRSTFQAVQMSVHKSQWTSVHSALAHSFYRQAHKLKAMHTETEPPKIYEGWNFNRGNYLFTTDTK